MRLVSVIFQTLLGFLQILFGFSQIGPKKGVSYSAVWVKQNKTGRKTEKNENIRAVVVCPFTAVDLPFQRKVV